MSSCKKLPKLIKFSSFRNKIEFFDEIAIFFQNNIIGTIFNGREIVLQHPKNNQTIQHIMSQTNITGERTFNVARAERIPWIAHILNQSNNCTGCGYYYIWNKPHKNKRKRWLIYCKNERYIIILEEFKNVLLLVTAYNVTPHREVDLMKEYRNHAVNQT